MGFLASAMLWRARAWMWVCGLAASMRRQGLPMGGDLEYADSVTLGRALEGRRRL